MERLSSMPKDSKCGIGRQVTKWTQLNMLLFFLFQCALFRPFLVSGSHPTPQALKDANPSPPTASPFLPSHLTLIGSPPSGLRPIFLADDINLSLVVTQRIVSLVATLRYANDSLLVGTPTLPPSYESIVTEEDLPMLWQFFQYTPVVLSLCTISLKHG